MRPPLVGFGDSGAWHLYVMYQGGSVQSFVNNVRQTNLAVSFGLLIVLAGVIFFTLLYTERVRALGKMEMQFAAGLSHELRTPLTAIRSAAHNMIAGAVSGKEEVVKYGRLLQDEGVRLSEMVEQALMFAETQSGKERYKLAPTDVVAVVERVAVNFRDAHPETDRAVVMRIEKDLPFGMTDATALTHCLQNLLINAAKYALPGTPITVEARPAPGKPEEIEISVADLGPGINRSDLRHIFKPFFRGTNAGSAHGNGLGLYLVKRTIESVKGRVGVATSENGSRFTLTIPALREGFDVK
jgi:signal transduction histidine kinase